MGTYIPISRVLLNKSRGRSRLSTSKIDRLAKNSRIAHKIIYLLGKSGQIALDVLFPRVPLANTIDNRNRLNYAKRKLGDLEKRGFVKVANHKAVLTGKGRLYYSQLLARENKPVKQKWDGKWRFVMFDIWERRKRVRDHLREELKEYGFEKVQHSVWAYPYDCEEFVALLKTDINVGRGLLFLVVERLEDDNKLRKLFKV
ncbi:MAG: hypothetical protein A2672_00500 [Candidatus Wildermuthbacteria bacterium RIFCSPHIGHO2_01_FULL_49_22b]|uniref:Transcriptional repressor PaaX-like central Cas2-like domain-containing protein n=1 Tax=Candidatus Wildermuthbacteria bacterium RIFCSPHIGHO2_01_FULL_49_22b TaxID=1802448 RepID=A0A1G2QY38_9BACT|nr:MAG: hypothetical protein A2672_00500 [Candidatus Wildermuthbacteria bacterium RIFCSPHIGHO2_01_FULL_49_22b]